MWLNYRRQSSSLAVGQSALHAYEASRMAASAPAVNDVVEVAIATKNEMFHLRDEVPKIQECPISIPWLKANARRFGPKPTRPLGFDSPKRPKQIKTTMD